MLQPSKLSGKEGSISLLLFEVGRRVVMKKDTSLSSGLGDGSVGWSWNGWMPAQGLWKAVLVLVVSTAASYCNCLLLG